MADGNHGSDGDAPVSVTADGGFPQGGGRPGLWGLLLAGLVVLVVGGYLLSRDFGVQDASLSTLPPIGAVPSTSTTVPPATVTVPSEATDSVYPDWMYEVSDIAVSPDGFMYVAAGVGVASLDGTGEWTLLDVGGLPVGTGLDSRLPGRTLTHLATGSDGTLWVAGFAVSHADDEGFGGVIDGWISGRILWWVARWHCPLCGEWTVFTTNEIPELQGDIGDVAVSGDGVVYASVGTDVLVVIDGDEWESYTVPLPTSQGGVPMPWSSSLAVGTDGVVWAATSDRGLIAFDGNDFTLCTSADGLPSDTVVQVTTGVDGTIWVATDAPDDDPAPDAAAGVASFDGTTWTIYTMADGLLSNNAVIATGPDGTVWAVHSEDPPFGYSRFDGTGWTANQFGLPVGDRQAGPNADGTLWTRDNEVIISFDGTTRTIHPSPFVQPVGFFRVTPVQWGITPNDQGPGIHTVLMIVDVRPLTVELVVDVSGRLIWDQTVVDLCGIDIRREGDGFLHIGDIFQTSEGCGNNPTAMQDAFDQFGLPETACLTVRFGGVDHEYCAPLR